MSQFGRELEIGKIAIRQAGAEILRRYGQLQAVDNPPADISTEADRASQEIILGQLASSFPTDGLCGEEATSLARANLGADRLWIVDPIDGTRGYAVKNGEFSVMIGLAERGEVVVGLVYEPVVDRLTFAERGQGCFVEADGAPARSCRVRPTSKLAEAVMSISRSQKASGREKLQTGFGVQGLVATYSAGVKLAQVARGETDLYPGDYLTLKDWDVCAGHLLVEEAGGKVSSVDGKPIRYRGDGTSLDGRGILATNGLLHETALDVIRNGRYVFTT